MPDRETETETEAGLVDDLAVDLVVTCARFVRSSARLSQQGPSSAPLLKPAQPVPTALWRAMAILDERGAMRVSDFAIADNSSQPSATNMLQRLEASGHVQRMTDPDDRRASLVSLTSAGRDRLKQLRRGVGERLGSRLRRLPPGQRDRLVASLQTIRDLMDDEDQPEHGGLEHEEMEMPAR